VLEIAPDVPDALIADFARLGQVLVNLVGNAIKFTAQGEVIVRVALESLQEDAALLRFSVIDTGIGIPRDKHQAIFDAFTQADPSTTREFGGTGLGLSISSRLVSLMGGAISLESAPGSGSTFSFALPAKVQVEALPSRPGRVPPSVRHLEVLVVDDNATNRLVLQQMLRGWEMRPRLCVDAADALAKLDEAAKETRTFGLALIDAHMPRMDGFELAARMRSHRGLAGGAILMLSSGAGFGHAARAREAGIAHTLMKPVKQSELFDVILGVLGEAAVANPQASPREQPLSRRLRVLLAEDNPINQKLVRNLLEKHGHEVVSALNGREAASLCAAGRFDVVLMDVQMPVIDGFQATAAIRQLEAKGGRRVPIVGVTAHAMKGDRERCLDAGMDGYVTKPVRPEALFAAIEQALREPAVAGPAAAAVARVAPVAAAPVAPAGPEAAVLDEASLNALVSGDGALLRELAQLYAQDTPLLVTKLRDALSRDDRQALKRAAHTLKGSAGSLLGRSTAEAAELLETIAGEGEPVQLRLALERLVGEAARLGEALAQVAAGKHPGD
jgi:CheY-like chemotaxis protein/HPt (histidine-containing phosphotransfer) domain-containing protein